MAEYVHITFYDEVINNSGTPEGFHKELKLHHPQHAKWLEQYCPDMFEVQTYQQRSHAQKLHAQHALMHKQQPQQQYTNTLTQNHQQSHDNNAPHYNNADHHAQQQYDQHDSGCMSNCDIF